VVAFRRIEAFAVADNSAKRYSKLATVDRLIGCWVGRGALLFNSAPHLPPYILNPCAASPHHGPLRR